MNLLKTIDGTYFSFSELTPTKEGNWIRIKLWCDHDFDMFKDNDQDAGYSLAKDTHVEIQITHIIWYGFEARL